jgi:hypothetical protein
MRDVHCEVGTASSHITDVPCRPLTAGARIHSHVSPREISDGQSRIGSGCFPGIYVSPFSIISPFLHIHLHLNCPLPEGKAGEGSIGQISILMLPMLRSVEWSRHVSVQKIPILSFSQFNLLLFCRNFCGTT